MKQSQEQSGFRLKRLPGEAVTPARGGFTLIELLISAAVFVVILGAVYLVYTTSHTTYARGETRAEIQQTARAAMDLLAREVRMAGYWCNPSCPGGTNRAIQEAQASALKIFGDVETSGARIYVAYFVRDNTAAIVAGTCPAANVCTLYRQRFTTAWQPEEQLATNVQLVTFAYFDKDGVELVPGASGLDNAPLDLTTPPPSTVVPWTNREAVRRIRIQLVVRGDPEENIPNYQLATDISPRNLGV
ncbi:MAG TPA: prepilin-type N-terminal cleavage/methylation domain-containing protein [Candidatus Methylomirabilis sp.]|nr:prepilin-type N-terminal cleavage/methylation domain-containing protein [Candidatus Methylomirabilis sp.]